MEGRPVRAIRQTVAVQILHIRLFPCLLYTSYLALANLDEQCAGYIAAYGNQPAAAPAAADGTAMPLAESIEPVSYTHLAVLVTDSTRGLQPAEQELIELFRKRELPFVIAHNKEIGRAHV